MCAQLHSHCGFSAGLWSLSFAFKPPLPSKHGEHFSRQNSKTGNPQKTEKKHRPYCWNKGRKSPVFTSSSRSVTEIWSDLDPNIKVRFSVRGGKVKTVASAADLHLSTSGTFSSFFSKMFSAPRSQTRNVLPRWTLCGSLCHQVQNTSLTSGFISVCTTSMYDPAAMTREGRVTPGQVATHSCSHSHLCVA